MLADEAWAVTLSIASALVNVGLLIVVVVQLRDFRRTSANDFLLQRKQATVDFLGSVFDNARRLRSEGLPELIRNDVESYSNRPRDMADPRNHIIRHYLNEFESMGTGVNLGIYDAEVVYTLRNTTVVRTWKLYTPWILERRAYLDQPELYEELEKLSDRIEAMRSAKGKPPISVI